MCYLLLIEAFTDSEFTSEPVNVSLFFVVLALGRHRSGPASEGISVNKWPAHPGEEFMKEKTR